MGIMKKSTNQVDVSEGCGAMAGGRISPHLPLN